MNVDFSGKRILVTGVGSGKHGMFRETESIQGSRQLGQGQAFNFKVQMYEISLSLSSPFLLRSLALLSSAYTFLPFLVPSQTADADAAMPVWGRRAARADTK